MINKEIKLELRNISKHFKGVYANKNININLYKGEILSILGENGSGKTTLMNVLSGIYTPDEGEIYINNKIAHTIGGIFFSFCIAYKWLRYHISTLYCIKIFRVCQGFLRGSALTNLQRRLIIGTTIF